MRNLKVLGIALVSAALVVVAALSAAPAATIVNDRWPHFSPDGSSIEFTTTRGGGLGVYVVREDGSGMRPIPSPDEPNTTFYGAGWFPNGDVLVAGDTPTATGPDNGFDMTRFFKESLSGATMRTLFAGINDERPASSPTGDTLVFESERGAFPTNPNIDVETFDIITLATRVLTHNDGQYMQAAWSPDGSKIAYGCRKHASDDVQICVMNTDGSAQRVLTSGSGSHEWPAWSPDSKRLAFFLETGSGAALDSIIMIVHADGSHVAALTHHDKPARDETPSWSPDGKRIAFQTNRLGAGFRIAVVDDDGSNLTLLTR